MFRFLGMMAALDAGLRRWTINLVPLNYALLLILLGLSLSSIGDLRSRPATAGPLPVSLASLADGTVPARSYVTVEGTIDPRYLVEVTRHRSAASATGRSGVGQADEEFLPLVDDTGRIGILITPPSLKQRASGHLTVTGMVRPLPKAARDAVNREAATLPSRVNAELMVAVGQTPTPTIVSVLTLAVCVPFAAVLGYVRIKRDLIFRIGGPDESASSIVWNARSGNHEPIDLHLTAHLRLDRSRSKRFVEVQAQMATDAVGQIVVGSHLDASLHVMGVRIRERIGFWHLTIPAASIERIVRGAVSFGGTVRPAAKVSFSGPDAQTITLSFGNVDQRERLLRALETHRAAGYAPAA